ncbi:hypothetical protein LTR53_010003, partial [Teratosphaeriaceae sp. CCFEE 6253]
YHYDLSLLAAVNRACLRTCQHDNLFWPRKRGNNEDPITMAANEGGTNLAALTDGYSMISRALLWDGSVPALDRLCDHLMNAAETCTERDAVRIATSLLIADHRRLPALQDAVCEYSLAKALVQTQEPACARSHLAEAHAILHKVEKNGDFLMSKYGMSDHRVSDLRQRIDTLQSALDEPLPRIRQLLTPPPPPSQPVVGSPVLLTTSDGVPVRVQGSDNDPIATPGETLASSPVPQTVKAVTVKAAKRLKRSTLTPVDGSVAGTPKTTPRKEGSLAVPVTPLGSHVGGIIDLTATPDSPPEARPVTLKPAKRKMPSSLTLEECSSIVRAKTASKQKATDAVPISSFWIATCQIPSGGTLAYDSNFNDFLVLKPGQSADDPEVRFGVAEVVKVFYNPDSLRIYITGATTNVSSGRLCIAFPEYDTGVTWFLVRAMFISYQKVMLSEMKLDRLNVVFDTHSVKICDEARLKQWAATAAKSRQGPGTTLS